MYKQIKMIHVQNCLKGEKKNNVFFYAKMLFLIFISINNEQLLN